MVERNVHLGEEGIHCFALLHINHEELLVEHHVFISKCIRIQTEALSKHSTVAEKKLAKNTHKKIKMRTIVGAIFCNKDCRGREVARRNDGCEAIGASDNGVCDDARGSFGEKDGEGG